MRPGAKPSKQDAKKDDCYQYKQALNEIKNASVAFHAGKGYNEFVSWQLKFKE